MNFLRAIKLNCISLIALMLLTQSVVAQHSVDHVFHDTVELCEVYISAEAPSLLVSCETTWNVSSFSQSPIHSFCSQQANHQPASVVARGPPQYS